MPFYFFSKLYKSTLLPVGSFSGETADFKLGSSGNSWLMIEPTLEGIRDLSKSSEACQLLEMMEHLQKYSRNLTSLTDMVLFFCYKSCTLYTCECGSSNIFILRF